MKIWQCTCGQTYTKRVHLIEHIGLLNVRWPRTSPDDEHQDMQEAFKRERQEQVRMARTSYGDY